jgi:hypothetical protein
MNNPNNKKSKEIKPDYVTKLESAYGAPSQNGFGSAVFFEQLKPTDKLEEAALKKYRYFVGEIWERFGEDAWMSAWKQVYTRPAGDASDIVAELKGITDFDASISVPMVLDVVNNAEAARQALSAAYNDSAIKELLVYKLGDGSAMSGILVAGRLSNGETTYLVFLYD